MYLQVKHVAYPILLDCVIYYVLNKKYILVYIYIFEIKSRLNLSLV